MAAVEDDGNSANEKRDAEKFSNGQAVDGGAVSRDSERDVEEKIRCNDSVV